MSGLDADSTLIAPPVVGSYRRGLSVGFVECLGQEVGGGRDTFDSMPTSGELGEVAGD